MKKNRTYLIVSVVAILVGIGLILLFRKQIWEKLPQAVKTGFVYVYSLLVWNGFIRVMIEVFYPNVLLSFKSFQMYRDDTGKLFVPIVLIIVFLVFFVVTFLHIEHNKDHIEKSEYKSKYGAFFTNVETFNKP